MKCAVGLVILVNFFPKVCATFVCLVCTQGGEKKEEKIIFEELLCLVLLKSSFRIYWMSRLMLPI